MLQRPSTSGAPLHWWDGSAKAARPHLSPHSQPSFNMAAVGRTAALTLSVSGCSDGTCPRFFWDKFHLEHPDHHLQPGSAFLGVGRCAAAPSARTQRPFCPATSRLCADRSPLLPLQVAQWSPPSPTSNDGNGSMTRDRGHAVPAVSAATSLSAARGGVSSEVAMHSRPSPSAATAGRPV